MGDEIVDITPVAVGFELTDTEEAELREALDEIHRGEFEDGLALLSEIKAQAGKCSPP
jgi:hypothetical protein